MTLRSSLKFVGIATLFGIVIQLFWGLGSWLLVMGSHCTTLPFLPEDTDGVELPFHKVWCDNTATVIEMAPWANPMYDACSLWLNLQTTCRFSRGLTMQTSSNIHTWQVKDRFRQRIGIANSGHHTNMANSANRTAKNPSPQLRNLDPRPT